MKKFFFLLGIILVPMTMTGCSSCSPEDAESGPIYCRIFGSDDDEGGTMGGTGGGNTDEDDGATMGGTGGGNTDEDDGATMGGTGGGQLNTAEDTSANAPEEDCDPTNSDGDCWEPRSY